MQSEYFWPDTQPARWLALSQHVSRLWWNPAAFRGSEGERSRSGVSKQFFKGECVHAPTGSSLAEKKIPDAEEFVFTFLCVSIRGEVMRTAENTTNAFPYFLLHTWAYSQLFIHSTDCFTATVRYFDRTARPIISSLKCFVGEAVSCPEIPLCWEEMASETL